MTPRLHKLSDRHCKLIVDLIMDVLRETIRLVPEFQALEQPFGLMCALFGKVCLGAQTNFSIQQAVHAMVKLYLKYRGEELRESLPEFEFESKNVEGSVVNSSDQFSTTHAHQILQGGRLSPTRTVNEGALLRAVSQSLETEGRPDDYRIVQNAINIAIRTFTAFLTLIARVREGRNSTAPLIIRAHWINQSHVCVMDIVQSLREATANRESFTRSVTAILEAGAQAGAQDDVLLVAVQTFLGQCLAESTSAGTTGTQPTLHPLELTDPAIADYYQRWLETLVLPGMTGMHQPATLDEGAQDDRSAVTRNVLDDQPGTSQTDAVPSTSEEANPATLETGAQDDALSALRTFLEQCLAASTSAGTTGTPPTPATLEQQELLSAMIAESPAALQNLVDRYRGAVRSTPAGAYRPPAGTNEPPYSNQVPTSLPSQPMTSDSSTEASPTPTPTPPMLGTYPELEPASGPLRNSSTSQHATQTPTAKRHRRMTAEDEAVFEEELRIGRGTVSHIKKLEIAAQRGLSFQQVRSWFAKKLKERREKEEEIVRLWLASEKKKEEEQDKEKHRKE